jgi:hypothetical protein
MGYLIHDPLDLSDPALDLRNTDDIERFLAMVEVVAEQTGNRELIPQAHQTAIRARFLLEKQ